MATIVGEVRNFGSNVFVEFDPNFFALDPAASGIFARVTNAAISISSQNFVNGQLRAPVPVVTPEPSTYALVGMGLAGLFGAVRRRRSAV